MLGVSAKASPGFPKRHPVADGGEDILQVPAPRTVIENLGSGGDRDPVLVCPPPEKGLLGYFVVRVVPGNEDVEVFPEGFPEQARWLVGREVLLEGGGAASPERVKPFGAPGDLFPRNSGRSLAG